MAENQLILIADDFGLSSGINKAILELLALQRLSGTSVMTNMPHFSEGALALKAFHAQADIGLHLTLTLGKPIGAMPRLAPNGELPELSAVMKSAVLGRLDRREIAREIEAQIGRFQDELGFIPDYIDGHQHVHILPIVRAALFDAVQAFPNFRPWIRIPSDNAIAILQRGVSVQKSLILSVLSLGFQHQCRAHGLKTNESFSGASEFDANDNYSAAFQSYLRAPRSNHLVMCHPGYVAANETLIDSVKETRPIELEFLKSEEFAAILSARRFEISRFNKKN